MNTWFSQTKSFVLPLEKTPDWFGNTEHTVAAVSSPLPWRNASLLIPRLKHAAFRKCPPGTAKHLSLVNPLGLIWKAACVAAEQDPTMAIMTRRQQWRCRQTQIHASSRLQRPVIQQPSHETDYTSEHAPAETSSVGRFYTKASLLGS